MPPWLHSEWNWSPIFIEEISSIIWNIIHSAIVAADVRDKSFEVS